jgi:hypothetical protein
MSRLSHGGGAAELLPQALAAIPDDAVTTAPQRFQCDPFFLENNLLQSGPMSELDSKIEASRRILEKIDQGYAADIKKLKREHAPSDDIQIAYSDWAGDRDLTEWELDGLLTQKLTSRAIELDVPLPHYPAYDKDKADWDRTEHWYRRPTDGRFVLTQHGRDHVGDLIWKKEERGYNRWSRWVTLAIGLIGTLTGLVSVIAANWEKFAAMFGRIWLYLRH